MIIHNLDVISKFLGLYIAQNTWNNTRNAPDDVLDSSLTLGVLGKPDPFLQGIRMVVLGKRPQGQRAEVGPHPLASASVHAALLECGTCG